MKLWLEEVFIVMTQIYLQFYASHVKVKGDETLQQIACHGCVVQEPSEIKGCVTGKLSSYSMI